MERKARSVELLKDLLGIKAGTKFPVNPDGYDSYIGKNAVTIRIFKCQLLPAKDRELAAKGYETATQSPH